MPRSVSQSGLTQPRDTQLALPRPGRVIVLGLMALTLAGCVGRPGPGATSQAVSYQQPSVDGLIYGPAGGSVEYNPAIQQQAYMIAPQGYANGPGSAQDAPPIQPAYAQPPEHPQVYVAHQETYMPPLQPAAAAYSAPQGYDAYVAAPIPVPVAGVSPFADSPYTLDGGDRVRVVVFGQEGLNASYIVDPNGMITMPLAGAIPARGLTKDQLAGAIADKLKQGYIRDPKVAVDIEAYRPFFILGEVNQAGQYPFVANMTVETAVAIAGGFSPRADKRKVTITRVVNGETYRGQLPRYTPLRPGDTIEVAERWF